MKLILCKECQDVVRLMPEKRSCKCGKCSGKYVDSINAIYSGELAVPLGFNNRILVNSVNKFTLSGFGLDFTAFVISSDCNTFKLVDDIK